MQRYSESNMCIQNISLQKEKSEVKKNIRPFDFCHIIQVVQSQLLRFPSRFHDGRFYVRVAAEKDVKDVNVGQDFCIRLGDLDGVT